LGIVLGVAPRYDPRLRLALKMLDDAAQPIAETCRRAGAFAETVGLTRPSYPHVWRLVRAERRRRAAARALAARASLRPRRVVRALSLGFVLSSRPLLVGLRLDLARPARAGPRA
jgi:hypothetical protein